MHQLTTENCCQGNLEITPYRFIYFEASSLFDSSSAVSLWRWSFWSWARLSGAIWSNL